MTLSWARRVSEAVPERMATFTRIGETRDEIRLGLQHVLRDIRKAGYEFEYWGVVELHKNLKPHMHLLQKGSYVPKAVIKNTAVKNGWGAVTDIRAVTSGFRATTYCAKHLCHSHGRRWDGRLIRYSRGFFGETKADYLAQFKDESLTWRMVWGRAESVVEILGIHGVGAYAPNLLPDYIKGEFIRGGEVVQTQQRTPRMGYGLLDTKELTVLAAEIQASEFDEKGKAQGVPVTVTQDAAMKWLMAERQGLGINDREQVVSECEDE